MSAVAPEPALGSDASIAALRAIFSTRLATLSGLLDKAQAHFGETPFVDRRLAPDMLSFGTQIAFTCDQARNFALFCQGRPSENFDGAVTSLEQARGYIAESLAALLAGGGDDAKLTELRRVKMGAQFHCELPGASYVHDFLMPNFYFHLVTAYDILRAAGVEVGKKDFMQHLAPHIRRT